MVNFLNPVPKNTVVAALGTAAGYVSKQAFYAYGIRALPAIVSLAAGGPAGFFLNAMAVPFAADAFAFAGFYGATLAGNAFTKLLANSSQIVAKVDAQKAVI